MTDTKPETADDFVRLSVNISPEAADFLRETAERRGESATETVRRALSVLKTCEDVEAEGQTLAIITKDNSGREIEAIQELRLL